MTWTVMRIVHRARRATRLLAAALPIAVLPAGAAVAKPIALSYLAYLAGFPVLSMSVQADLPSAGPVNTDGAYGLQAAIATQGSLANLYPYHMNIAAHGRLARGDARPGQFHSEGTIMNQTEAVTLTYRPGGRVDILAVPLTRQAQEASANGTANGTIDPASLVMSVVAAFAEHGSCAGHFKLFDGVRRYDLNVQQVGTGTVQMYKQSFYQGPATECQATPQLIQGFAPLAVQSQLYPQSANIWLAPALQGQPAIPVRIETQNALGSMVFDLVGAQ